MTPVVALEKLKATGALDYCDGSGGYCLPA